MKEGQPTYEQLCQIIGAVYSDAYLRLEFLEKENQTLLEDRQNFVESIAKLRAEVQDLKNKASQWNNGNEISKLEELLREKRNTSSPDPSLILSHPTASIVTKPTEYTVTLGETLR